MSLLRREKGQANRKTSKPTQQQIYRNRAIFQVEADTPPTKRVLGLVWDLARVSSPRAQKHTSLTPAARTLPIPKQHGGRGGGRFNCPTFKVGGGCPTPPRPEVAVSRGDVVGSFVRDFLQAKSNDVVGDREYIRMAERRDATMRCMP